MIDLTEGNGQKSSLGAFALRYALKTFLFPFYFNLCFSLFLCLVYVYICLFRIVLGFLFVFKHDRLLDFTFLVFALFLCWLGFLGKDLRTHDLAYTRRLNSCVCRPVLAWMMMLPRKPYFFVCFVLPSHVFLYKPIFHMFQAPWLFVFL